MRWLLLLSDPFQEIGARQKTLEPQKLGNSPEPGLEVVENCQEQVAQRVHSWTVQNDMRGVLRWMSADAA